MIYPKAVDPGSPSPFAPVAVFSTPYIDKPGFRPQSFEQIRTEEGCAAPLDVQLVMSSVQVTQENKRHFAAVYRLCYTGPKEESLRSVLRKICCKQPKTR